MQGDSLTTVAADSLDREPAEQTPDYDRLAKALDKKSPLEIMDQVRLHLPTALYLHSITRLYCWHLSESRNQPLLFSRR